MYAFEKNCFFFGNLYETFSVYFFEANEAHILLGV